MIIPDIVEQHWEETAILWRLRSASASSAAFSLSSLAELDERVEAHLDGLRVAGEAGMEIGLRTTKWEDPGESFAVAALSFERENEGALKLAYARAAENPILASGIISALGWQESRKAHRHTIDLIRSISPVQRLIAVGGASVHRSCPDEILSTALDDADAGVRARACRATGELGRAAFSKRLRQCASGASEVERFWSAWSLAVISSENAALSVLREFLSHPQWHYRAAQVLFRRVELPSALELHRRLADKTENARLAIMAAGVIGDPALVPWLLEYLANPKLLRLAADAFQTITGADFVMDRLRNGSPPRPPAPEDDGTEAADDPDEPLTWPNVEAVRNWWTQRRGQFTPGVRYILGKPMTIDWLKEVLRDGKQHQRAAAALEVAIRQPGTALFNVKAPGLRQIESLTETGG